ncbi:hypothetical protein [Palaeococcus sp. (in: euryarchaeotes)]
MREIAALLLLLFTLTASWILWESHEAVSCFNSPYCMTEHLNITDHILIMQQNGNEWRIVTYTTGKLSLHRIELSGSIIPDIKDSTKSVRTHIDYSPLTFENNALKGLKGTIGLIAKFNGSVKAIPLKELQKPLTCSELLKLCSSCKLVLGEGGDKVRLGYTNLTSGYLVVPSPRGSSIFVLEIKSYNATKDAIIAKYPMGIIKGYTSKLNLPPIENTSLPANVSQYLEPAWGILITGNEVVLNPDPWSIVEELGECRTVYKITIHNNGTIEKTEYGLPCWRR